MAQMRKRQKQMIQQWIDDNPSTVNALTDVSEMPNYWECHEIFPHEFFHQNANRFINDNAPNPHMQGWW